MPTYAYACTACGHRFEVQQSFTDSALTECPECAGRLRKLFNSVGIVFKGSGFYRTDSRGSAPGEKAADGAVKADAPSKEPSKNTPKEPTPASGSSSKESSASSASSAPSTPASKAASKAASSAA